MDSDQHRLGELGSYYHVTTRGLDRKPLFHDDRDRHTYLLILTDVLRRTETRCLAIALMSNHVHLVIQTVETPLSNVMHMLNTRWALHHNRRHGGTGHVFQGPFWSKLIEDEDHLLTELGYVHLNPVRAGVVPDEQALRRYPWTGHAALMGNVRMDFLEVDRVLSWFSRSRTRARNALSAFVAGVRAADRVDGARPHSPPGPSPDRRALSRREAEDLTARRVEAVIGDSDRIEAVLRRRNPDLHRRLSLERDGWTPERLLSRVCLLVHARPSRVAAGGRRRSQTRARALFLHLATSHLGVSRRSAARMVGVTGSAAIGACERGETIAGESGLRPSNVFDSRWLEQGRDDAGSQVD